MMHTPENWESNCFNKKKLYTTYILWDLLLFSQKVGHLEVQLCDKKSGAAVVPHVIKLQWELKNTSTGTQKNA